MDLRAAAKAYLAGRPSARSGLAAFLAYCDVEDTADLRAAAAVAFVRHLGLAGYARDTVLRYRSAVNPFFRWLYERELVPFGADALRQAFSQQANHIPARRPERIAVPDEADVRALVEAARAAAARTYPATRGGRQRRLIALRDLAIVETLRATGARPAELAALRCGDLDEENQVASAPDGRRLIFDLRSWGALARYLAARGDREDRPLLLWQAPVFARHDPASAGRNLLPMRAVAVTRIVHRLRPSGTLTATGLRARFGQRLLAATKDEKGTGRLLGLKDLTSVRRYGPGA
jgi:site-specific recombinase XerD